MKYIEKHLSKGFDIKHIKRRLAEAGHPIEAIEDAATFVLGTAPPTKKRIPKFMIIYGIVLILIISAGIWFFWFKATEVKEYIEEVKVVEQKFETKSKFDAMSDVDLLKYAAEQGDRKACDFIEEETLAFACSDKYWERDDCVYESFIGTFEECKTRQEDRMISQAISDGDLSACDDMRDEVRCRNEVLSKAPIEVCNNDNACLYEKALLTADVSVCRAMSDEEDSYDCLVEVSIINKNPEDCPKSSILCRASLAGSVEEIIAMTAELVSANTEVDEQTTKFNIIAASNRTEYCAAYDESVAGTGLSDNSFKNVCTFMLSIQDDSISDCSVVSEQDRSVCERIKTDGCSPSIPFCKFLERW